MSEQRMVVHEICWRSVFPWLIIFRTFAQAKSLPVLFLATVGALLTPAGWQLSERLFINEATLAADAGFRRVVEQNGRWPTEPATVAVPNAGRVPTTVREILATTLNPLEPIFATCVRPVASLLDNRLTVTQFAYYVFGFLWTLLVWGFCGGAITRLAALQLGREEKIGFGSAVRHATRRLGAYVASPLFPLLGVALGALMLAAIGALLRWDWAVPVVGACWFFALLTGLAMTILLFGLLFGWPLMWGVISCEKTGDAFEAFSRSYSYVFQRPLHYLFYAFLATTFGAFSWLVVYHFSVAVVAVTDWAAVLGTGTKRWGELPAMFGGGCLIAYAGLVRSLVNGFGYGLFWCLSAAMYLLLRQDVDQTELDELYVEREDRGYELPPIPTDAAGVPGDPERKPAEANPAAPVPPSESPS